MIRYFVLVGAMVFAVLLAARGEGPDDRYVQIYNLIQEADALNDGGQGREAGLKYVEAQKMLKAFQAEYPSWNGNVVSFRLNYLAAKIEPLAQTLPPATNAPPPVVVEAERPVAPSGTNKVEIPPAQIKELQDEIKRLTEDNKRLENKLKEALSVQPAAVDPRELAKAEQQIRVLQKEKELYRVSLEQEKAKPGRSADPAAIEQEQQILADVKLKLAQQTNLAMALQKENDALKKQLADPKTTPEAVVAASDVVQQLQAAKGTIAALQSSNLTLRTEQILLDARVADLSKQVTKRGKASSAPHSDDASRQLENALARLSVYEAKPMPYSPEELALFKQPDLKVAITESVPVKRTIRELPPGAGPLIEEAKRAVENGRYDEAEKKFLEVLRQDEKNIYILGNLAVVQIELKRLADAEKTVAQALQVEPRDPASLFTMGLLKFRQGKYDEALDALSLSATLIPDEPRTQYFLGKTLIEKGNRTAAEAALRKAVHLRPGWGEAHFSLAMVYATQQPPFKELAQWHYQKAIEFHYPRDFEFEKLLEDKKATARNP